MCGLLCVKKKKQVEESGAVRKGQDVWSILNIECFQIASISMAAGPFFFFDPVEMNPLISKTRAVGQPLMSAAILSLTGRSTEFDLVFSIRVTEEVSLCISLCKKVTVVISSVKAERVTPMSCVGVWCPLKQSQAYFHTKIIHVKIQLATYCSHSIYINFKDEWQLQYLKRLAPLPCQ